MNKTPGAQGGSKELVFEDGNAPFGLRPAALRPDKFPVLYSPRTAAMGE
jgi:hypothetical protein